MTTIETFGLRSVDRALVLKAAEHQPGKFDEQTVLARLRLLPGVEDASVARIAVDGKSVLYVGIKEAGVTFGPTHRKAPAGDMRLPTEIEQAYDLLMVAAKQAVDAGKAEEDHDAGHSMMRFPPARAQQERFVEFAAEHFDVLRRVARGSRDARQRAVAVLVIGYAKDKRAIIADLVYAARDVDATVRNNAVRNLSVLLAWAMKTGAEFEIDKQLFFRLLGSLHWTDRNKGMALLVMAGVTIDELPAGQSADIVAALAEMANWQTPGHCLPAALLLGRLAGDSDLAIYGAVTRSHGDRDARGRWVRGLVAAIAEK